MAAGLVEQAAMAGENRPIDGPRNWRAAGVPGVVFGVGGPKEPIVLGEAIPVVIYVRNTGKKPADVAMIAGSDDVVRPAVRFTIKGVRGGFSLLPPGGSAKQGPPWRRTVTLRDGETLSWRVSLDRWVVYGNESWTGAKALRHPGVYWFECVWTASHCRAAYRLTFVRTEAAKRPPPQPDAGFLAKQGHSVSAIARMPEYEVTYENLARMFASNDYHERYSAAVHLSRTSLRGWPGTKEQADKLARMALQDAYWATRQEGAKFAYFRGKAAAGVVPALIEALDSEAPAVRAQCVRALGATGNLAPAMPRIKKMLAAGDQLEAIAWVLWESGAPGLAVLNGAVNSNNTDVRLWCGAALVRSGRDAGGYLKELKAAIGSGQRERVISACTSVTLAGSAAAPAGAALAGLLADRDGAVRYRASTALKAAAPADPVVVRALAARLADKDAWDIGSHCMAALGRIGPKAAEAVPAILQVMEASSSARFGGILALEKIAPRSPLALPVLVRLLHRSLTKESPRPGTRLIAAIGAYGPSANAAVGDLIKAMKVRSHHAYHVDAAIWALGQIGPAAIKARDEVRKFIPGPFAETARRALRRIEAKNPSAMPAPDARYTNRTGARL